MSPGGKAPTVVFKCSTEIYAAPGRNRVSVVITTITEEVGDQPTKFEALKVEIGKVVCDILLESTQRRFKADIDAGKLHQFNKAFGELVLECGTVLNRVTEKGNQL